MSEGEEELNVGAVRLEEVASAANVSLSTASKALRGKPHVSEKTRIRVIDAAQRLGYSAAEAMASMARLSVRDSHGVQDFRVGIIGVDMKGVFSRPFLLERRMRFKRAQPQRCCSMRQAMRHCSTVVLNECWCKECRDC
ncbi:hypothetical protein MCC00055_07760 [Bifidobacterium longum subsp. longum]|nr:hypothetical protein MCC00055_07760 [Bifidobacterium longum subsp. longum]